MRRAVRKGLGLVVVAATVLTGAVAPASASSHREAPGITELPKVDSTDLYVFNSYEPGRAGYVTLIANYYPFQAPFGGPNYFALDPNARYRILVDNTGDGVEDVSFQFRCVAATRGVTIPVGGIQVAVPLINVGAITGRPPGPTQNRLESCTLGVANGRITSDTTWEFARGPKGSRRFAKPVDNIGEKSIPDYESYARSFITEITVPGCSGTGRLFVGQRREPFAVNVGEIFDLVNLDPVGAPDAEPNPLQGQNITTFALELPAECLTRNDSSPVIGVWQTALLPKTRTFNRGFAPGDEPAEAPLGIEPEVDELGNVIAAAHVTQAGPFSQVSRLGNPLVNEVVIGLPDKDTFNYSHPSGDAALAKYVTNPTLPELLEILFGVSAPNNFPRTDLVATFATGIQGLNFLSDGQPHEIMRLNTSIAATPAGSQNNLGVLGGDNAGFPNGRRPGDDVVDIALRASMGVLCHAFPGVFCNPADAPSGTLPYTDGVLQDASQFDTVFPYLRAPLPGSPNGENGIED
jgi:hypothetical protein